MPRGLAKMWFPGQGKGLMNRDRITKQVRASCTLQAQEEILQLVNLDTISVHFSLCNQPICSSLRVNSTRPVAGRCLPGTALSVSAMVSPGRLQNKARSEPASAPSPRRAQARGSPRRPTDRLRLLQTAGPSPGKASSLEAGRAGICSKGL